MESNELNKKEHSPVGSESVRPKVAVGICAALALSAIDAMAYSGAQWDIKQIEAHQTDGDANLKRWEVIGEHIVAGPKASQGLGHAWYQLAQSFEIDGVALSEAYEMEGLGEFIKAQAAETCYAACYGNCYGNCYSNCFGADS